MNKHLLPILAAPLVVLAALGAYALFWYAGARSLASSAEQWATDLRFDGWTVEMPTPRPSGFPLSMGVSFETLVLAPPPTVGTWRAKLVDMHLTAPLWSPSRPTLRGGSQPHTLTLQDQSGRSLDFAMTADTFQATVSSDKQKTFDALSVRISDLTLAPATTGRRRVDPLLKLTALEADALRQEPTETPGAPTWTVAFWLNGLTLAPAWAGPFGTEVKEISTRFDVLHPLPMATSLRERLSRWRTNEGAITINALRVNWPPFELTASGSGGLGDGLQPWASLTAHARGLMETIEAAESIELIRSRDASMARVVLAPMARPDPGGPLHALTIQILNRTLAVGPVALLELPRLNWGATPTGREEVLGEQIQPGFEIDRWGKIVRKP